jgi:iron complex transport system substrate-binding protein
VVVISCCGYDVERTLQDLPLGPPELQASAFVVNGSHYFSRPGPRLVDSLEILAHILHPDVQPLLAGLPAPLAYSRLAAG